MDIIVMKFGTPGKDVRPNRPSTTSPEDVTLSPTEGRPAYNEVYIDAPSDRARIREKRVPALNALKTIGYNRICNDVAPLKPHGKTSYRWMLGKIQYRPINLAHIRLPPRRSRAGLSRIPIPLESC